jgi:hypothetical protein
MCQSTLTFSLRYRDFCSIAIFALVTPSTRFSNLRYPMTPKGRDSRSRSLATSPLARSNDSYLDSRGPRRRTSDGLCHLSSTIFVAHTTYVAVGISHLAISRLPLSRFGVSPHELPICRSTSRTTLLVIPIDGSCPPELRTFSTPAL